LGRPLPPPHPQRSPLHPLTLALLTLTLLTLTSPFSPSPPHSPATLVGPRRPQQPAALHPRRQAPRASPLAHRGLPAAGADLAAQGETPFNSMPGLLERDSGTRSIFIFLMHPSLHTFSCFSLSPSLSCSSNLFPLLPLSQEGAPFLVFGDDYAVSRGRACPPLIPFVPRLRPPASLDPSSRPFTLMPHTRIPARTHTHTLSLPHSHTLTHSMSRRRSSPASLGI
jgi:hypothetical protein